MLVVLATVGVGGRGLVLGQMALVVTELAWVVVEVVAWEVNTVRVVVVAWA